MVRSPYTPGAGHRPPVLAGRDDLLKAWSVGLSDVTATGRQRAADIILTAPRGVGKTATVLAFQDLSEQQGFEVVRVQAASGNANLVGSLLRRAHARAEDGSGPWQRAKRAFDRLAGVNFTIGGIGAGIATRDQHQPEAPASPEDLADALSTVAREVRKERPTGGLLVCVDEIQAAARSDLTLLAAALQGLNTEYPDARVMFAASGLPHTFPILKEAGVTHPDRLFDIHSVPLLLEPGDARYAIVEAARRHGVAWEPEAADLIITISSGYPAHLQVFADQTWLAAPGPGLITIADANAGVAAAAAVLERRSLGPRFETMTDRQREFVAGLAVIGGRTSGEDLAVTLGRPRSSLSDLRDALITEGDIYVPRRGELALTVPVFGPYLLANYEHARRRSTARLLPLEEMQRNVETIANARRTDAAAPEILSIPKREAPVETDQRRGLPTPGGAPRPRTPRPGEGARLPRASEPTLRPPEIRPPSGSGIDL